MPSPFRATAAAAHAPQLRSACRRDRTRGGCAPCVMAAFWQVD